MGNPRFRRVGLPIIAAPEYCDNCGEVFERGACARFVETAHGREKWCDDCAVKQFGDLTEAVGEGTA